MKVRAFAAVGWIAMGAGILGGCASTPTRESTWEMGNRPQTEIPGATRSEIKGLAMGAARSKGWSIVRSSDELLVVQRPLDPASPTAVALGVAGSTVAPTIEVTSAFVERSGGVTVGLGAELVSQPPGEKAPKRTDITERYRSELTQSLDALRGSWSANRQRIAGALPPLDTHSEPSSAPPGTPENPLVRAWGETLEDTKGQPGASGTVPASEPRAAPAPDPGPRVTYTPVAPAPAAKPALPPAEPSAPAGSPSATKAPTTSGSGRGPAPVVDGSGALAGGAGPARAPIASVLPPAPSPIPNEPVAPEDNMLTLSQASGTGTWAYYAEQYARLRGCNVGDQGAVLIESHADGEIHKVPCVGTDSHLIKCQNGVCRGLQ